MESKTQCFVYRPLLNQVKQSKDMAFIGQNVDGIHTSDVYKDLQGTANCRTGP